MIDIWLRTVANMKLESYPFNKYIQAYDNVYNGLLSAFWEDYESQLRYSPIKNCYRLEFSEWNDKTMGVLKEAIE